MRIAWREVEPLPVLNGSVEPVLATVDALRRAWEEALSRVSPAEFSEARQRNLRRHAIETGIIERLYDADWGVTEALVAEGITIEVAEREGRISDDALVLIHDQLSALDYLVQSVREGRDLSVFFVRELHQLITRHQPTYEARDALGNLVQVPLPHGEWKIQPHHVRRGDGSLLEYTPPGQVQSQMERLVELYAETAGAHPVVRAAWLHHRFICIHPFADGNGRVARALTLLVLLQKRFAPLVVDRRNREEYISSLDHANDGDLRPLVRLFGALEMVALRTELERPTVVAPASRGAVDIAKAHVERLAALAEEGTSDRARLAEDVGAAVHARAVGHLQAVAGSLRATFEVVDATTAVNVRFSRSDLPATNWRAVLALYTLHRTFLYTVQVRTLARGSEGTVFAIVVDASSRGRDETGEAHYTQMLKPGPTDTVTLVPGDTVEARWPEVEELIDRTLAVAVDQFGRSLG